MTKQFRKYLLQICSTAVVLSSLYGVCGIFGGMPYADQTQFAQIRLGIWIVGIIAAIWFVWRGYDGFCRKLDFLIDENDHRW
jgi:hypothetical protein